MMPGKPDYASPLDRACQLGKAFLNGLDENPVDVSMAYEEMKKLWDWELPEEGKDPVAVVEELNNSAVPGLVHNQSGRFFSWVIGGSHPASIAADWLTSAWDQNSGLYNATPASAIVEEITGAWLKKIFNLPDQSSFAFITGGQMANFTCLLAGRNQLFHSVGWDIEKDGFYGAPKIRIIVGDQKHSTITKSLRMMGFGSGHMIEIPSDPQTGIDADLTIAELQRDEIPTLLILQAGDIHTGAFDDFKKIIPFARRQNCWVHIDGAFGLWAEASPGFRHLMEGADLADSWSVDGHKWLNVPYDSGYSFVAHPEAHYRAINQSAIYLGQDQKARDQMNWVPELSRRARGFATFAAIKELGMKGITDLVDRCCRHAKEIVEGVSRFERVEVIGYPIINQGMVRFLDASPGSTEEDHARYTEKIISRINRSGEAFFQPSTYRGIRVMRISVSGWRTNDRDVQRTVDAVRNALAEG